MMGASGQWCITTEDLINTVLLQAAQLPPAVQFQTWDSESLTGLVMAQPAVWPPGVLMLAQPLLFGHQVCWCWHSLCCLATRCSMPCPADVCLLCCRHWQPQVYAWH